MQTNFRLRVLHGLMGKDIVKLEQGLFVVGNSDKQFRSTRWVVKFQHSMAVRASSEPLVTYFVFVVSREEDDRHSWLYKHTTNITVA